MTETRYIVRADKPFQGSVQSILNANGIVEWSGGLTFEQYQADRGFPVRVIDRPELESLIAEFEAGMVTEPTPITAEQWDYALGVLPPSRWESCMGVELFHISELVSGSVASWYARIGNRYWAFNDLCTAKHEDLARKVGAVA